MSEANTNPHSWVNRHIKFCTLEHVHKILGRLEDDSGSLLKLRQQIAKELAYLSKSNEMHRDPHFVTAPLPKWVAEKMLTILWHRDFKLEVDQSSVVNMSDDPNHLKKTFANSESSGSDTPLEPTPESVVVKRSDERYELKERRKLDPEELQSILGIRK